MYRENTDLYSNYSNIKIGRVLSIIGIILSLIFLFLVIWLIVTFGWTTLQDEVLLKHAIEEKFGVPVK